MKIGGTDPPLEYSRQKLKSKCVQAAQCLDSHSPPPPPFSPPSPMLSIFSGHEHYQGSSQHWRGGKRGGGRFDFNFHLQSAGCFFYSCCMFLGGSVKGGKQPEDLFSHFDFIFRLQSSCWRERAASGLPHVVVLLSHCVARTYVGICLYMYMSIYIYIYIYTCICGQPGSVCLLRTLQLWYYF